MWPILFRSRMCPRKNFFLKKLCPQKINKDICSICSWISLPCEESSLVNLYCLLLKTFLVLIQRSVAGHFFTFPEKKENLYHVSKTSQKLFFWNLPNHLFHHRRSSYKFQHTFRIQLISDVNSALTSLWKIWDVNLWCSKIRIICTPANLFIFAKKKTFVTFTL